MPPTASEPPVHVVIVGGGVAALETLMALHDLARPRVRVTLVAPEADFELKQARTAEPFSVDHVRRHTLHDIASHFDAHLVRDELSEVVAGEHEIRCASGRSIPYDVLVLTPGARPYAAYPGALTFGLERSPDALNGLLADLEHGGTRSVAFIVPPGVSWPLPLYELALMTARHTRSMGVDDATLTLITPESSPLAIFGRRPSEAVAALLADARIEVRPNAYATLEGGGTVTLRPGGERLHVGRAVSLPLLRGPMLPGVPCDEQGFIPVDDHGRVTDLPDVYAAGDATTFAVKQGGLACQQADAVAEHIAAAAGAAVDPRPFRPVLRGKLLTGAGAQYLRHDLGGGAGEPTTSTFKLWAPPSKVVGRYLGVWLAWADRADPDLLPEYDVLPPVEHDDADVPRVPEHVDVDVPISHELRTGDDPMSLDTLGVMRPGGRQFATFGPFRH
jgi:sulfide:quinone oxidoreductase